LTVLGSGFTGASQVSFGSVAADSFYVLSDTALRAIAPAQSAGTIDVTVTSPGGTSSTSSADHFTYSAPSAPTVTGLSTSTASTGTTMVTISVTGFSNASQVTFGAVPASTFVVLSDTKISAFALSQAAGTVDLVVTNDGGDSATNSSDQVTYSSASGPSISSIATSAAPTVGARGVLLTGSGLLGATSVMFGSVAADFTVYSDTKIVAVTPAESAGSVSVTVTTPSGTTSGASFTYYTNSAPSGTNDSYTAHTGTSLVVSASGLLSNDSDSMAIPSSSSGMDLLTVGEHELGHVLGLPDVPGDGHAPELMSQYLAMGVRRVPTAQDVAMNANPALLAASLLAAVPVVQGSVSQPAAGSDQPSVVAPAPDTVSVFDQFFTALGSGSQDSSSLPATPLHGTALRDPTKNDPLNA
jgi:hypothetical protein